MSYQKYPFFPQFHNMQKNMSCYIWKKPDLEHYVYILKGNGKWIAGVDENSVRLIAGIWESNEIGVPERIIGVDGKYAADVNREMTNEELTDRIWKFLGAKAISMDLVMSKDDKWLTLIK